VVKSKIKESTVKRFHQGDHHWLQQNLADFIGACNYVRRLEAINGWILRKLL